jgi:hypothetical protein
VAFVKGDGISGHETAHDFAEWGRASAQKKVKMIRNQGPSIALGLSFLENGGQPIKERFAIFIVPEDVPPFYAPGHDVLQQTGGLPAIGFAFRRGGRASNLG